MNTISGRALKDATLQWQRRLQQHLFVAWKVDWSARPFMMECSWNCLTGHKRTQRCENACHRHCEIIFCYYNCYWDICDVDKGETSEHQQALQASGEPRGLAFIHWLGQVHRRKLKDSLKRKWVYGQTTLNAPDLVSQKENDSGSTPGGKRSHLAKAHYMGCKLLSHS